MCDIKGGIVEFIPTYYARKPAAPVPLLFYYLPFASKSKPIDRKGDYDYMFAVISCISCVSELLLGYKCSKAELFASLRAGPRPKNGNCTLSAPSKALLIIEFCIVVRTELELTWGSKFLISLLSYSISSLLVMLASALVSSD